MDEACFMSADADSVRNNLCKTGGLYYSLHPSALNANTVIDKANKDTRVAGTVENEEGGRNCAHDLQTISISEEISLA